MSLVDTVHHDGLASFEYEPRGQFALLTDGDDTLFVKGTTELYSDAAALLDRLEPAVTALVTADDNAELAQQRAAIIGAEVCVFPADRKHWMKFGLYCDALQQANDIADFYEVLVLGDRWLMDVAMGKFAAIISGVRVHAELVRRDGEPLPTIFDRLIFSPLEKVGYVGATALRADGFIRPRITR